MRLTLTPEDNVQVDVQPLFTNTWYDVPRVRRPGTDDGTQPDTNLGPNGIRDPFPFQDDTTAPFVLPAGQSWEQFPELDETNGVWRQARIDLSDFAGSDSLRFRFDFSTAAAFDLGELGGIEIKAIPGKTINDGDVFSIGEQVFEFEVDPTVVVPAGTSLNLGESILVRDASNQLHEFTFDASIEDITGLPLSQSSAEDIATATATLVNDADVGITATALGNQVVLDGAVAVFAASDSLIQVSATREDELIPGVAEGSIPVFVSNTMTAEQVAEFLVTAFAEAFTDGNEDVIKSNGNIIKLYGLEVNDIGPLGGR